MPYSFMQKKQSYVCPSYETRTSLREYRSISYDEITPSMHLWLLSEVRWFFFQTKWWVRFKIWHWTNLGMARLMVNSNLTSKMESKKEKKYDQKATMSDIWDSFKVQQHSTIKKNTFVLSELLLNTVMLKLFKLHIGELHKSFNLQWESCLKFWRV